MNLTDDRLNYTSRVHMWINESTVDGDEITSAHVAEALKIGKNYVSAALSRMASIGVVERVRRMSHVGGGGYCIVFKVVDRLQEPTRRKSVEFSHRVYVGTTRNRWFGPLIQDWSTGSRTDPLVQGQGHNSVAPSVVSRMEDHADMRANLNRIAMGLLDYAIQLEQMVPDVRTFSTFELNAELTRRKLTGDD